VGNGLYFSFSVFLVPLIEEFHWSRGLTAGAQSVSTIQVAFAIDRGFEPLLAASVFGAMGLLSIAGRASFGLAADRIGGPLAATISYGCTACGSLALLALDSDRRVG
jgi:hypothetical protein